MITTLAKSAKEKLFEVTCCGHLWIMNYRPCCRWQTNTHSSVCQNDDAWGKKERHHQYTAAS